MSAPTLTAARWDSKKMGWIVPRPIYLVWWMQSGSGVEEKYVVADTRAMAIAKAKKKWGVKSAGAKILIRKGVQHGFYSPPNVHLR